MDYYHYAYQCPYLTGVECKEIHCEYGCRIKFQTAKSCKRFLHDFCANDGQNWKKCSIAENKNRFYEEEYDTWKKIEEIKEQNRPRKK